MPPDRIFTTSMSSDARAFPLSTTIVDPVEGQVYPIVPKSPYPFEIIAFFHQTDLGPLDASVRINGVPVEFAANSLGAVVNSDGTLLADGDSLYGFIPSASDSENYTVPDPSTSPSGASELSIRLDNFGESLTPTVYVFQFHCRRLSVNVPV